MKKSVFPCFLDRLTDYYPKASLEKKNLLFNSRQYRKSVIRDLSWLLNTNVSFSEEELAGFYNLKKSVLCFGIQSYAGVDITTGIQNRIQKEIFESIIAFEPRIIPESLEVNAISNNSAEKKNKIQMQIDCELWSIPVPEEISIKTEFDLETGKCTVEQN